MERTVFLQNLVHLGTLGMAEGVLRIPVTMATVVVAMAGEWGVSLLEVNFGPPSLPQF